MANTLNFDIAYTALSDLANDTPTTPSSVTCRIICGVDVSFTRGRTSFLRFESPTWNKSKSLYDAAEFIAVSM